MSHSLSTNLKLRATNVSSCASRSNEKGDPAGRGSGNGRNGTSSKRLLTEDGEVEISVPRDRAGTFEPQLVAKGQTRFDRFDDKILSLYARGMTVREIQGHLNELYGVDVSPDLISRVTDAILDEVREWQNQPLDPVYPVIFFDALRVKIRDEGLLKNKAVYVALAFNADGEKEALGLWIEQTEGAKFWLKVMNELKLRGINDILIAVVDGLKGFPEAITTVFPQTLVQTCIVHLIRNSLAFVTWKDRKTIMPSIRAIYQAENAGMALSGWRSSKPNGASAIRRPAKPGAGPGSMSSPSSRLRRRSAKLRRGAQPVFTENHQNQRKLPNGRGGV